MVVRRIKIWKRREILIALRAHGHLERSREIFLVERSARELRYFNHRMLLIPNP